MEIHEAPLIRFFPQFKRFEAVTKDHTAVIMFKYCPRKYFYRIVLGRAPKESAPYFAWGSAYHKFREVIEISYERCLKEEKDKKSAMEIAFTEAANAGMAYWKKNGQDQPAGSKWEFMTKERLLKSFMVAFQWWQKEKNTGAIVVLATEQPFNVAIGPKHNGAEGEYEYTGGRFDQIVRWNGKLWGRDFKTTSKEGAYYERGLEPNDQFIRYTFGESMLQGERVHGQIIEVLMNSKKSGPTIKPYPISFTEQQVSRWQIEQLEYWLPAIDRARELDMYPMSEHSCKFCEYHSVCKSPSESSMAMKLQTNYVLSPWDHTRVGQDNED